MRAYDLAIQNVTIAEHLLQLYQMFRELRPFEPDASFQLAVCEHLNLPVESVIHHTRNENVVCSIKATIQLPSCLLADEGMNFLLRQSVLVASAALESFIWDVLRENTLIVIRAKERKADETLRNITLTLDDYLSLQGYDDVDMRLQQIILKRFERGAIYDINKIDEIANILTVKNFWEEVSRNSGIDQKEMKRRLQDLITRRNQIAHRADRPDESTQPEDIDGHGLRKITYAWVNNHVSIAKTFVSASSEVIKEAINQLELIIQAKEQQKRAQQTLKP